MPRMQPSFQRSDYAGRLAMTKEAALKQFFGRFGIAAHPSTAVPNDVVFPYMTYEVITSAFEDGEVGLTVNLW